MRSRSLEARLRLGLAASVIAVAAVAALALGAGVRQFADRFVGDRLEHDLETVVGQLTFGPDGDASVAGDRLTLVYEQPYSGHYFQVDLPGKQPLRSRSLWDAALPVPDLSPGEAVEHRVKGPRDEPLLLLARGAKKGGRSIVVAVAEDMGPLQRAVNWVYAGVALGGVATLVILLVVQHRVVRGGMAPLESLRGSLRRLESGDQNSLDTRDVPAEVLPLVEEVNALLEMLQQRLERSRKTAGNLAHALKTPLTILGQLQRDSALDDHPALRDEIDTELRRLEAIVERELKRARLAGGRTPGVRVRVAEEMQSLIETLTALHRDEGLNLRSDIQPGCVFAGDREDFLELMGVLLDNAFKWADTEVVVRVEAGAAGLIVTLDDDGPGCPTDKLNLLMKRGWRLDETKPGSGLGLAIAGDIVRQYGGSIGFSRSILGGLAVRLVLPGEAHMPG